MSLYDEKIASSQTHDDRMADVGSGKGKLRSKIKRQRDKKKKKKKSRKNQDTIDMSDSAKTQTETSNRRLLEDTIEVRFSITEDKNGKLVAQGEFSRAGVPTANGRIYPKELFIREIRRLENSIKERKVYGELDHPCLISPDFKVLTETGWKSFKDVREGERVWSNIEGRAVLSTVEAIVDQPYEGPVTRVFGRNIDSTFTLPHKFLLAKRPDTYKNSRHYYATLSEIVENPGKHAHSAIPKTAMWPEITDEVIRLPGNNRQSDLVIDAKLFAAFMGLYLSEGNCASEKSGYCYNVFISQKTEWSRELIEQQVLSKFPRDLEWSAEESGFRLADRRLWEYLKPLGDCYQKFVPENIKSLGSDALKELIFWFFIGDGRLTNAKADGPIENYESHKHALVEKLRNGHVTHTRRQLFSASERLIDDLHECLIKTGGCGTRSVIYPKDDYEFAGRIIKAENKAPLYQLNIAASKYIWMDPRFINYEHQYHKGHIYCLKVTNGNFYIEQNGKSFWTGNSDGKTQLKRASHIISNVEIDDDGVVTGVLEVLGTSRGKDLKAIIDGGGVVGVSSRGFGSTQQTDDGYDEVQEDFTLMTWDVVADPANGSSYPRFQYEGEQSKNRKKIASKDEDRSRKMVMKNLMESGNEGKLVEAIEKRDPELIEQVKKELMPDVIAHYGESLDEVKRRYQNEVLSTIAELREQARSEVRAEVLSETMSDPKRAGAKEALEKVKTILRPYILPEDTEKALADKDTRIRELETRLESKEKDLTVVREKMESLGTITKELGYKLQLERKLANNSQRDKIIERIGKVDQFKSLDELNQTVDNVIAKVTTETSEIQSKVESKDEQATSLKKQLKETNAKLEKVAADAVSFGMKAILERKIAGHPAAPKIRKLFEAKQPTSPEQIDQLIESVPRPSGSGRYNRVQSRFKRRRAADKNLVEDQVRDTMPDFYANDDKGDEINGLNEDIGADIGEIKRLAGM